MARLLCVLYIYIIITSIAVGVKLQMDNFHFKIDVHSIENRGGRCADKDACGGGEGCCESSMCAVTTCHYALHSCALSFVAEFEEKRSIFEEVCSKNRTLSSISVFERNGTIGMSSYTIDTFYTHIPDNGLRVFIELLHNRTILIDRFIVVSSEIGQIIGPTLINGLFGFASIEISTIIKCRRGFCGINCNIANETCFCNPGYTGEDCNIEIDDCVGVSCGKSNMQCVDLFMSYNCSCTPGYTGENCETEANGCSTKEPNCKNEECVDKEAGKSCKFTPFELEVTIHSFMNPGGKCIDVSGTCDNGSGCCDDEECKNISCDYMFLFCERTIGTSVSYARSENRGNCENLMETNSFKTTTNDSFSTSLYGIRNPIVYNSYTSPINKTEIYIELIDDDRNSLAANNELIDRFVIPVTGDVYNEWVNGIFEKASIVISVNIKDLKQLYYDKSSTTESVLNDTSMTESQTISLVTVLAILFAILCAGHFAAIVVIVWYKKTKHKSIEAAVIEESVQNNYERAPWSHYSLYRQQSSAHVSKLSSYSKDNGLKILSNYDTVVDNEVCPPKHFNTDDRQLPGVYCFSPSIMGENAYDYDYGSPYWEPSSMKDELISQLHRLNIPEIESKDLQELEHLGCGAFGSVVRGTLIRNKTPNESVKEEVAVKKIGGSSTEDEKINLLKEAAIMGQFNHPNIIQILGYTASDELEYKIVMEYMPKGSLHDFLPTLDKRSEILPSQLLAFSRQIASAMNYLELKGYIHRDLAARNILITLCDTCKICDFGLSRVMHSENFYLAKGGKIPVKWTAPESITYRLWSTASDVWSYGCVLYEIWSLGIKPFHGYSNSEAFNKIMEGYRLAPPSGCPRSLYELMINCWNIDSEARPSFSQILSILNKPEYKILIWSEEDSTTYSEESRTIGGPLQDGLSLFEELQNTYKNQNN